MARDREGRALTARSGTDLAQSLSYRAYKLRLVLLLISIFSVESSVSKIEESI